MNAQATRTADSARSWRLRPWPNDPTTAHLVFLDHLTIPTEETVANATARAKARGAKRVRTSALFPRAAEVLLAAGYHPIDTLALLRLDLLDDQAGSTIPASRIATRAMRPWHFGRAAAIDVEAFGATWGNNVESLREICRATPVYRARVVGQRRRITGFAIVGAAGSNGYLQRLAVHPAGQRGGIGAGLVTDAVEWMRGRGLSSVLVNTGIDNAPALALYERFGFRRLSEQLVIAEHRFAL
ncbi:MAG TPA: GNAT family N-acetyltransferase [Ilumatobacter sp.]|nr:GNAT family N-acetyltransferase [Ilumatobacter sp.]